MRRVVVAGMSRTGTSWAGLTLGLVDGFTYYREPDNFDAIKEAEPYFAHLYLTREDDDRAYRYLMTEAMEGRFITKHTMKADPGPILRWLPKRLRGIGTMAPWLYRRQPDVLLKVIHSSLTLEWLSARWPDANIMYVVRHPCGQFASWRKMGWEPRPHRLLDDETLLRDHLGPFAELVARASDFWERAGALWGAVNYVVHRQAKGNDNLSVIPFEWLCQAPHDNYRMVFDHFGLDWNGKVDAHLSDQRPDRRGRAYSVRRNAAQEIDKWRTVVDESQVARCRSFAEPFDVPLYAGFDPRAAEPKW